MGEEGSIILDRPISEHTEYPERLEEELERTKEKYEITKEELKKERTIREYYESLLLKYPPKEEKEDFKKIEAVSPYELWEKGLTGYGAEEEIGIKVPIARDVFAILNELAQRKNTPLPTFKSKTSQLQELSHQYILVDRCTKFVFAPIAALSFALGLAFYLYANVGMAVGLIGIGITSLLLTIVFSITKSALKG